MKTLLLILIAATTLLITGCVGADYSVGATYYNRPASVGCLPVPPLPIPIGYNPHSAVVLPNYQVERPIIPAGFPCPELVPSYSVVRPSCGRWGRSPGLIVID